VTLTNYRLRGLTNISHHCTDLFARATWRPGLVHPCIHHYPSKFKYKHDIQTGHNFLPHIFHSNYNKHCWFQSALWRMPLRLSEAVYEHSLKCSLLDWMKQKSFGMQTVAIRRKEARDVKSGKLCAHCDIGCNNKLRENSRSHLSQLTTNSRANETAAVNTAPHYNHQLPHSPTSSLLMWCKAGKRRANEAIAKLHSW